MTNPRASLRSDNCPISIGMSVRFELEQVSAFVGIRKMHQGPEGTFQKACLHSEIGHFGHAPETVHFGRFVARARKVGFC